MVDFSFQVSYVTSVIHRSITPLLLDALQDNPVVLLNGARQSGKSTLVQWLAENKHRAHYLTLDDASVLSAVHSNPSGFLAGFDDALIIDEVQRAPELFLAIKSRVDKNRTRGRFLLTGSANVLLLPKLSESLAGRMEILTLHPFSQSELEGTKGSFIDRVFAELLLRPVSKPLSQSHLLDTIITGGFPEVQQRDALQRRNTWFSSYLTTILQRDIRDIANIEGLTALPRLLSLLATRSGSLLNFAELSNSSAIPQTTLKRYMALLETTFLIQAAPSWSKNLSKRLIKTPKLYLTDTGLMTYLLGTDAKRIKSDGATLGKVVETFVLNELVRLISWSKVKPRLFHFRTQAGQEIDFLLERRDGAVVCIEVKSSSTIEATAFKAMQQLAGELKKQFLRGIVLYTGQEVIPFGKNLFALPIQSLFA